MITLFQCLYNSLFELYLYIANNKILLLNKIQIRIYTIPILENLSLTDYAFSNLKILFTKFWHFHITSTHKQV